MSATSVDVVALTADGEFTQAGTTGVGVGVAIGVADRTDTAYITGTVSVSAGSLDVAVLAPSPSSFTRNGDVVGVGDSTKVGVAGSLGINVSILDHEAYLDTNAALTLDGRHQRDVRGRMMRSPTPTRRCRRMITAPRPG